MRHSSFLRCVSAVCCGTLIALPLQNGYVSAAAPDAATTLANSLRALQDGENRAPRDHWDPKYVEAQLGNDPARTFAWVRDHTYWIPYHGILRGPVGVLMDRQGDSLDRALLLATMLKDEGQTVRLAHGTIGTAQASALVPVLLTARASARPPTPPRVSGADIAGAAAKYELDAAVVGKWTTDQTARASQQFAALHTRVADQTARLSIAVGALAAAGDATNSAASAALAALTDHWWVQTQGAGTWRDWDPLGPSADALRVQPDRVVDPANVPADLYHEVSVRVIAEQRRGSQSTEKVVLEHTLRPSAIIGDPVAVSFAPASWPQTLPRPASAFVDALKKVGHDERAWTAVLSVGTKRFIQNAVTDSGELTAPSSRVSAGQTTAASLGGAIGDVFGSSSSAAPPAVLSAVWLEYDISAPGANVTKIRRQLFDLLGPAARATGSRSLASLTDDEKIRRGLALIGVTDILIVGCVPSPAYLMHLQAQAILANRDLADVAVKAGVNDDYASAAEMVAKLVPGPSPLYSLALARLAANSNPGAFYVDAPSILTRHTLFAPHGAGISLIDATDIVANPIGVDPREPSAFGLRLAQGVLDTNAEAVLASDRPTAGNTAWAFDPATGWVTLKGTNDPTLQEINVSADTRQRIINALATGRIVVAPRAPIPLPDGAADGWWEIDSRTGRTLGMGESGWGQELAEYTLAGMAFGATSGALMGYMGCMIGGGSSCGHAALVTALVGASAGGIAGVAAYVLWSGVLGAGAVGLAAGGSEGLAAGAGGAAASGSAVSPLAISGAGLGGVAGALGGAK
jgi:hypothetical protein